MSRSLTHKGLLREPPIPTLPWDTARGSMSMWMFMATEAMLFVSMFFSYFYLGAWNSRWPLDELPKLKLATIMLVVLLASSVVLYMGERMSRQGRTGLARVLLGATILMGCGFIVIQVFEYKDHLKTLLPTTDAYGSIFYTITTLHFLHVVVGLAVLTYTLLLPDIEGKKRLPHRPYHNAALYWHFVDTVWVFVVVLLYYSPHLQRWMSQ